MATRLSWKLVHLIGVLYTPVLTAAPPAILSTASLDGQQTGVCFDQALDAAIAADSSHYQLNGAIVSNAVLQSDGRSVKLTVSGLIGETFVLTVDGVRNLSGQATNQTVTGRVLGLNLASIGAPTEPGVPFSCAAGAADLRAGGVDIWGTADSFSFLQRTWEGDFDLTVQVSYGGLTGPQAEKSVRLFATKVLPEVQSWQTR